MVTGNEDKIKVLEKALVILELELSMYLGVCDAINTAVSILEFPAVFRDAKLYGIELPERRYFDSQEETRLFSYPCTLEGRQQRIEVLQEAIQKLKAMNTEERKAIIDKIIYTQFRGVRMDNIYYNDRFNALNKLSDEELLGQNSELN